jgi:hypothetical protein
MIPSSTRSTATAPKGPYRYPETTFDSDSDYVKLRFFDYKAPFSTQGGGGAGADLPQYNQSRTTAALGTETSTMYLYMPEDIEGQYGANWDNQNLSEVARGAMSSFGEAAGGKTGQALGELFNTFKVPTNNFFTKGTGVANAISQILSTTNFGSVTVNDVFSSATGQILNPNTEVLYKGPKMRTFGLNFKMAPRNQKEADSIKNIIQTFKYATLPKFGGAGDQNVSFVTVPQIVDVSFMKGNTENKWVVQYKPAVITNLDVSYTPDGAWATLPNGSPVATTIKISFQETKMVYAAEVVGDGATY